MSKTDGGPAYPCKITPSSADEIKAMRDETGLSMADAKELASNHTGMTLRDWFAGQALVGLLSFCGTASFGNAANSTVIRSYEIADAMLAERSKSDDP
jgi:hypothetical protein